MKLNVIKYVLLRNKYAIDIVLLARFYTMSDFIMS